jgi:hypothetical protein
MVMGSLAHTALSTPTEDAAPWSVLPSRTTGQYPERQLGMSGAEMP